MEESDFLNVVMWFNIRVSLPFTMLVIALCCLVQTDFVPIYYLNLLISNLVQLCTMIAWVAGGAEAERLNMETVMCCGVMASLGFRMCISLERCLSISRPRLQWIRQAKGFLLFSVSIWTPCVIIVPPLMILKQTLPLVVLGLLLAPVFIGCLTGALRALKAATATPAEEKRRIVGMLVLLLINYTLMIVPTATWQVLQMASFRPAPVKQVSLFLVLSSPFMDLILFVFMRKGPVDKLLACVCCRVENSAELSKDGGEEEEMGVCGRR